MNREPLLNALATYRRTWVESPGVAQRHKSYDQAEERAILEKFERFVGTTPQCFERTHLAGHITGSAIVVSQDFQQVLLTLHAKLGIWLQLGGHADGNHLVHEVASTEVMEESGLQNFLFYDWQTGRSGTDNVAAGKSPVPFDLDAHWIPPNPKDLGHWHYDIRYVIVAPRDQQIAITDESHDLRWFHLDEARRVTSERSMHRQFDKIEAFAAKQLPGS